MNLDHIVDQIGRHRLEDQALLLAVSGIDGSGKTTIAVDLAKHIQNSALIHLDAWHNPPEIRFNQENPAEHFYKHAFRFAELFELLIHPLKQNRKVNLTTQLTRLPENDAYSHTYDFKNIDVIVLEGIFLFKQEHISNYDFALWVDCSFDTALQRAIARNQEGLSEEEIIRDYETIYFPAQEIHFQRDDPKAAATWTLSSELL